MRAIAQEDSLVDGKIAIDKFESGRIFVAGETAAEGHAVFQPERLEWAVFVGIGSTDKTLNPMQIIGRQLTLMGSFVLPIHMYWEMVRFIVDHNIQLDAMVTHRFPIERAPEAFSLFDSGETGKVLLEWS